MSRYAQILAGANEFQAMVSVMSVQLKIVNSTAETATFGTRTKKSIFFSL